MKKSCLKKQINLINSSWVFNICLFIMLNINANTYSQINTIKDVLESSFLYSNVEIDSLHSYKLEILKPFNNENNIKAFENNKYISGVIFFNKNNDSSYFYIDKYFNILFFIKPLNLFSDNNTDTINTFWLIIIKEGVYKCYYMTIVKNNCEISDLINCSDNELKRASIDALIKFKIEVNTSFDYIINNLFEIEKELPSNHLKWEYQSSYNIYLNKYHNFICK